MELFLQPEIWASLLTLTALEIVLGIDNVVFIALVVNHLPPQERKRARYIGLFLALFMRIALLFSLVWLMGLTEPFIHLFGYGFSGKDLMMIAGGLFLIYKATTSIHDEMTPEAHASMKDFKGSFAKTIAQVVIIDFIFSFDSIITAVGLTQVVVVIIVAMVIAMLVMLVSSGYIADFIAKHATLKMLALTFIMMIGVLLVAEGLGFHVPKGYIYFSMAFSLGVEVLNMTVRRRALKNKPEES
jgi:predicted tellurium resistance membrane protein TerC